MTSLASPTPSANTAPIEKSVLLIEDQRALAELMASMLRSTLGCNTEIAGTLHAARSILSTRAAEFMVVVCDMNLPDAPYGESIDMVSRHGLPIIAMTATLTQDVRDMAAQGTIVDYVLKKGVTSYEHVVRLIGRMHNNAQIKVLVADDSVSSREVIKRMLQFQGLQVLLAPNGAKALGVLDQHPDIKLALVDYNMPEVDGFEFVLRARKKMGKDRLSIIGISGENRTDVSARFLKHGANDFIGKPYSYEELVCRVNQNIEMLELLESTQNLADRDSLTGLYNRRYFYINATKAHQLAHDQKQSMYTACLDIDHFKKVNDTYGHDGGDVVLRYFAQCLRRHFPNDLVARMGGEEFSLQLGCNTEIARQRLNAFREDVCSRVVDVGFGGKNPRITVSLGGHVGCEGSLEAALTAADLKLYEAKHGGRNRLVD